MSNKEEFDLFLDKKQDTRDLGFEESDQKVHDLLSLYQNATLSDDFPDKVLRSINFETKSHLIISLRIAAFCLIAFSLGLLALYKGSTPKNPVIASLNDNLKIDQKISKKKYYGIFISSTMYKPCREFLREIKSFNSKHKGNNNFEIIFIETTSRSFQKSNESSLLTLDYRDLKNKEFIKNLREGPGPEFIVLDESGQIVTKHIKNKGGQNFSDVLNSFSQLLRKET